jgi:hypothetical protein
MWRKARTTGKCLLNFGLSVFGFEVYLPRVRRFQSRWYRPIEMNSSTLMFPREMAAQPDERADDDLHQVADLRRPRTALGRV